MSRKTRAKQESQQKVTTVQGNQDKKDKHGPGNNHQLNFLLVLVAILPFVFSRTLMDPVISIRYLFLAGFLFLFVVIFYLFIKSPVNTRWPLLVKLVFGFGIAYGIWNFVGLATSINKQQVYFGLGRHFLSLLLLFVVVQVAGRHEKQLFRLCALLTVTSIIHSIIGIGQYTGAAFTNIPGNAIPYGLMANRNLFGSAQVLLLPFSVFVLYRGKMPWKLVAGISITGIICSAILSQTRSSWLAAIVFIVVSLLLVVIFSPSNRKKWAIGTLAGVVISVFIAFLFVSGDTEGEFSKSIRDRTQNIFATDTTGNTSSAAGNVTERLKIWKKTGELIKDNVLTGVGLGNWKLTVPKYGSEGLAWSYGKYIPDHPHNDYLLVLSESGIPGMLLYYAMWIVVGIIAFKNIRGASTEEARILNILMFAGLAAFATDSFFSFPGGRIEHTLYLVLMAGIIIGTYLNKKEEHPASLKKWIIAIFLLIAGFNFFLGLEKSRFEKQLILSKSYQELKNYNRAIEEGNKGKSKFVNIGENGFPIESYIGMAYNDLKNHDAALKEANQAIEYHPYNKALYINKGTIYTVMGQNEAAIKLYLQALKLTPDFDMVYFNLASNYFQLKNYKATIEMLNRVNIDAQPVLQQIKREAEFMLQTQQQ